jgi:hypothetical protein
MESEDFYAKQENNEGFIKKESLTETLSKAKISETDLPFEIKTNPELLKKCKERELLIHVLDSLYKKIPTLTDIDTALEKELLSFEEAEKLYTAIIDLIENDKESSRLLLYFPIELLPDPTNKELGFFSSFYKNKWKELLKEIDIRENFNVGDIQERELRNGPLAKVSKAAHLIPPLLEKGIINKNEIFDILENENDETIIESILDTLRILADKKYLDNGDLDKLATLKKVSINNTVKLIRYDQDFKKEVLSGKEPNNLVTTGELFDSMHRELSARESSIRSMVSIPESRTKWLMDTEKEKIREKYSEIVYTKVNNNDTDVDKLLENTDIPENCVVVIQALEKVLLEKPDDKLSAILSHFKKSSNADVKNALLNTLSRLDSVGMLNEKYFSKSELEREEVEIEKSAESKVKSMLSKLETDSLLAVSVYPVVILYGSHIKGYGKENSDTDMGVFIKEAVPFDTHEAIKNSFNKILSDLHINGSIMEFWLKNKEGSLWIQDFEDTESSLGDSLVTSPLTGVWYGEEKTIRTLQAELLPEYLYSENKQLFGHDARKLWLKDMERSLIQYRLLHKGYKKKNLPQGGIVSPYRHEIDGESMFYDSGFRRLATKIYLEKVFLPQLKKE